MSKERLLKRIEQLLQQGQEVLATRHASRNSSAMVVDLAKMKGFRSASLSFIERVYGLTHTHYQEFDKITKESYPDYTEAGIAILESIKDEVSGDWLFSIKGLITADVFADFIEMANYLLEQNYKDAAAVIVGSVLEEHLRQLAQANNIETVIETEDKIKPKKADRLNADLANDNIYSKLDQKAITMWLDLRNKAAHGKYDEYNKEQVTNMISGIVEFMARVPA